MSSDNDNIGGAALGVCWALSAIAMVITTARLYTQAQITRQLGLSDALLSIVLTFSSIITVQYHYGWGQHQALLSQHDRIQALKYNAIGQTFGVLGSTFGRLSTITTLINLFGITPRLRGGLWTLFTAQLVTNVVIVVCLYAQCTNVVLLWDEGAGSGSCWNPNVQTYLGYAHSAFNAVTDLFLTFFPAYMIRNLQMNTRRKVGVAVLLGLSILAFIAVILKIVKLAALANRGDYTYNTVALFTWVLTEAVLLNIAASAPILRPLYKRLLPKKHLDSSYEMHHSYAAKIQVSHGRTGPRHDDSTSDNAAILSKDSLTGDNYYHITITQSYSVAVGNAHHP
ncbi:hypothetical protein LT330_000050 [Penicillium expansum]|uniref:Rhodopsin domain-containing protein n=1 Tax=Penicillium expansum TaxID=27334 RepID=A0A0A2JNV3_PENEN|nr:hypothetical protein PEX2_004520 [Penicillium expansum]KAK4870813.1 hypothetical protein LT330_000050 [Penicillium expansum]KGO57097.1 hypothetical protein PEX2_004520 [Penicillium expansum]KGO73086.1 hypothetical protein PEX1_092360 [Penicillium expansum]